MAGRSKNLYCEMWRFAGPRICFAGGKSEPHGCLRKTPTTYLHVPTKWRQVFLCALGHFESLQHNARVLAEGYPYDVLFDTLFDRNRTRGCLLASSHASRRNAMLQLVVRTALNERIPCLFSVPISSRRTLALYLSITPSEPHLP